jgi:hypothetical protein
MAKYDIHHSCGHAETKDLFGKETDRQRYIAWAGAHGQCSACRRANKDAEVMAVEVEHDLPLLTGSDKQIAWARAIRAEQVTAMMAHLDGIRAKTLPKGSKNLKARRQPTWFRFAARALLGFGSIIAIFGATPFWWQQNEQAFPRCTPDRRNIGSGQPCRSLAFARRRA